MTDFSFLGGTPLARLRALMQTLRSETGCPWDKAQDFASIAPYTVEEAYEVKDAIERGDMEALREELGDLLFQVIFHSQMAEEGGVFTLDQVCDDLCRKMVRRHPHVFSGGDSRSAAQQTESWEAMKAQERQSKKERQSKDVQVSRLDGIALALPALKRAEKLQKRAARSGFDWPDNEGVLDKISEEAREVAGAVEAGTALDIEEEIGDLLFSVTNLARRFKVDPEQALARTNHKFTRRFQYIERAAQESGLSLEDMSLKDMDKLWNDAKGEAPEQSKI